MSKHQEVSRNLVILLSIVAVVISVGGTWLVLSQVSSIQGVRTPPEAKLAPSQEYSQPSQEDAPMPPANTITSARVVLDIRPPPKDNSSNP